MICSRTLPPPSHQELDATSPLVPVSWPQLSSLFTQGSSSNHLLLPRWSISSLESILPDQQNLQPPHYCYFHRRIHKFGQFLPWTASEIPPQWILSCSLPLPVPAANINLATVPGHRHAWREQLPNRSLGSHLRKLKQTELSTCSFYLDSKSMLFPGMYCSALISFPFPKYPKMAPGDMVALGELGLQLDSKL